MPRERVLLEFTDTTETAFTRFAALTDDPVSAVAASETYLDQVAGLGVAVDIPDDAVPVPMFSPPAPPSELAAPTGVVLEVLRDFAGPALSADVASTTTVVTAEVERRDLATLAERGLQVWPSSPYTYLGGIGFDDPLGAVVEDDDPVALAQARPGVDCRPFRPAVTTDVIRRVLGVPRIWQDGFRGQNVVVGVLDEGIHGATYPVAGGWSQSATRPPGSAPITSHGSMCAADVLLSAPWARLYDYPFLGVPDSGGALAMFQKVLEQRRLDGTPHLTTNSYGFAGLPPRQQFPNHEVYDLNHPIHRKVREVVASGAPAFFAAGNCGAQCPSGNCQAGAIGPGHSIHASNSLAEVITIGAVNSRHERVGYSAQGPGMFAPEKPDLMAYSHFFGNFGPGRPGGDAGSPFDNGTSAATPVAAGVAALLLSAFPGLDPARLRDTLVETATRVVTSPWDADYGRGIISAGAAYSQLKRRP